MKRLVLPAVLVMAAACDLEGPCTKDVYRCDGGVLERCVAHPGGFSGGGIGDIHHSDSSPNSWEVAADCGAGLCIAPDAGRPFCALDANASEGCSGGVAVFCEGTTAAQCKSGHVVERTACGACLSSATVGCDPFFDDTCCTGHQDATCQHDTDCASGLTCVTHGTDRSCQMACSCAEGAPCAACNVLWNRNAWPEDGAPSQWVCKSSTCTVQFQ